MTEQELEALQAREQSLRMTIARLVDAVDRYPSDLRAAVLAGKAELRREPLWYSLEDAS
jgi:hypothetical protein